MLIFASAMDTMGVKLPREAPRTFDIVFVDGRGRKKFWDKAVKYLKPGGWVVWDDAERPKYWPRTELIMKKFKEVQKYRNSTNRRSLELTPWLRGNHMRLKPYNWFYNRHKMDTAVVLLNGPSLGMVPLDWMSRYITFGGNKIYETYSPSYYVNNGSTHFSDSLSVEKIMVMMSREDHLASFLNRLAIQVFPHTKAYSIISSDAYPDYTPEQAYGFSFDPLVTIGVKGSVLYPMLQIIYYMGFKKVRLLGFDYNYVEGNPHFYPEDEQVLRS